MLVGRAVQEQTAEETKNNIAILNDKTRTKPLYD
jgi:hypothetical protein